VCLDEVIGSRDEGKHQVAAHSCDTKIADSHVLVHSRLLRA